MKFLSLFSGCGGMDLGLEKGGMRGIVLGNAVSVPVIQWIAKRIIAVEANQ
jgi:site-specific DNA-cytosine methylase